MTGEANLIQRITKAVPSIIGPGKGPARLGIGDDAALLRQPSGREWVLSCDAFVEGTHFLPAHPPESVGYKALARAASDLAAMGATPSLFLLTLALPAARTGAWLDGFLQGMRRAARSLKMRLAGGDTTKGAKISASLTVLGEIHAGRAILRSGARPGDLIYVSEPLGRAQLGLELVRAGHGHLKRLARLLEPHLYPQIRTQLGIWLARAGAASAMIDISDGLSTDLARLAAASGVGARLSANQIPIVVVPPAVSKLIPSRRLDPLQMALNGGDDYELLFTVPRRRERLLRRAPGFRHLTRIGEITRERRLTLVDSTGKAKPLKPAGWDPFIRT